MSKWFKVKIIQATSNSSTWWYKTRIGETFEVQNLIDDSMSKPELYYVTKYCTSIAKNGPRGFIQKCDCEIVAEKLNVFTDCSKLLTNY